MNNTFWSRRTIRLSTAGAAALLLATFVTMYFLHRSAAAQSDTAVPPSALHPVGVSCRGRIEPEDGVIHVSGPVLNPPHFPVVQRLAVKVGDHVHRGDLIAVFFGREQLAAAYQAAKAQAEVAQRRLDEARSGAKPAVVAAQQDELGRLNATLANAKSELARMEALYRTGDVSVSDLDVQRTATESAERAVQAQTERIQGLKSAGPAELRVSEAELQLALADERRAQQDYEAAAVYAPADGEILRVFANPGEEVGGDGVVEMGDTRHMYVVAEIYETDVPRVHVGQHATISGDLLQSPLTGVVERVDQIVKSASVLPGDTTSFSDNRIVEARIHLDRSAPVAGFINGKVNVVIEP